MKSQKKSKPSARPRQATKKPAKRRVKSTGDAISLIRHREVEERFIGEHPEAFDPYVGEWVALDGAAIIAHGDNYSSAAEDARRRSNNPYMFRVLPRRKPNEGYLF